MRPGKAAVIAAACAALAPTVVGAKVARAPLEYLVEHSDFIGVVEVGFVRPGIPFLLQRVASARVLEVWKGPELKRLRFAASPTWICDVSDALAGEKAVVFLTRGRWRYRIAHSGRGRLPVQVHGGEEWATYWPEFEFPEDLPTLPAPDPDESWLSLVQVAALRDRVGQLVAGQDE